MDTFIDIHSHLLPGIDDGAKNLGDAIELAQYAVNSGISHSVLTPHIHLGRYDNDHETIHEAFIQLKNELIKQKIPLKIAYAAEVHISPDIMPLLKDNKIPFLGRYKDQNIMLLEFPHSHIIPGTDNLIRWLFKHNIRPIIVHPERNKELQADISKIKPFLKMGCLLQITAGSLIGKFGPKCEQISRFLIENKYAYFVATDAHNIKNRPPELADVNHYLVATMGKEEAKKLLYFNPWNIVKHKF